MSTTGEQLWASALAAPTAYLGWKVLSDWLCEQAGPVTLQLTHQRWLTVRPAANGRFEMRCAGFKRVCSSVRMWVALRDASADAGWLVS